MNSEQRAKLRKNGGKTYLCIGKNNTCEKEAKKGNLCIGCTTGFDKMLFQNRKEGENFVDEKGVRYTFRGGQTKRYCNGDDNTCMNLRYDGSGLCHGHQTGFTKYGTEGLKKNDVVVRNGEKKRFNGVQLVKLCKFEGCNQSRVHDGHCKTHSPHWKCKFPSEQCSNIRTFGDYCARHKNGILNKKQKSELENDIAKILRQRGINFRQNESKPFRNTFLYPDFNLIDSNIIIETDGKQHFQVVKYWNGDEGLKIRQNADKLKDEWCLEKGYYLLRISYKDKDLNRILDTFFDLFNERSEDDKSLIYATQFYSNLNRGYTIINH